MKEDKINWDKLYNDMSVDFQDASGIKHSLKGYNDIERFLNKEVIFWQKGENQSRVVSTHHSIFASSLNELRNFKNNLDRNQNNTDEFNVLWNSIRNHLLQINNKQLFFSDSEHAKFLLDLSNDNSAIATVAYNYLLGKIQNIGQSIEKFEGALKAYEFINQKTSQIVERRKYANQSLDKIKNEWIDRIDSVGSQFDEFSCKHDEWSKEFIANHDKWVNDEENKIHNYLLEKDQEIKELKELYEEKLRLEAPVKYWQNRILEYNNQGKMWLKFLVSTIVIFSIALSLCLYNIPEAFHFNIFKGDPEAIKGLIIFAAIISFGAYLGKTFTKLTFSSFHLMRDAEEREQLTLVYLALMKTGNVEEKERELILQALFSRSDPGLIGGDSSPTMPGIGAVLDRVAKG